MRELGADEKQLDPLLKRVDELFGDLILQIRFIYIAIPVAVSAFAAYGSVYLLFVNVVLLPIFFRRKKDFLTPILAVIAAIFSFLYISSYTSRNH